MATLQLFELPSRDVSVSQAKDITAWALTFREKHEGLEGGTSGKNVAEHQRLRVCLCNVLTCLSSRSNTKRAVSVSCILFFCSVTNDTKTQRNASSATLRVWRTLWFKAVKLQLTAIYKCTSCLFSKKQTDFLGRQKLCHQYWTHSVLEWNRYEDIDSGIALKINITKFLQINLLCCLNMPLGMIRMRHFQPLTFEQINFFKVKKKDLVAFFTLCNDGNNETRWEIF